tara:strand:+ start:7890 stop:8561 length:672 start_codon:yes stop_codon:yes gene_type:complete
MISTIDNRLVDSYIDQQIKYKNEAMRKKELANDRTHIANRALIIVALGIAIGLALYLALSGVGNAQSFEQTKKNINTTTTSIQDQTTESVDSSSKIQETSEDELIDVDSLINESNKPNATNNLAPVSEENVVRNYVIFDRHEINEGNVSSLWVGRKYIDENTAEPEDLWCYIDFKGNSAIKEKVILVNVINNDRQVVNFTSDLLRKMGMSSKRANQLVKKCGI